MVNHHPKGLSLFPNKTIVKVGDNLNRKWLGEIINGKIIHDGKVYHSISAFSLAYFRTINKFRQTSDGWSCCKVLIPGMYWEQSSTAYRLLDI